MNPAPSIIAFTTSSGLGYGFLSLLALASLFRLVPADRWLGLTGLALALGFITAGLISSTFHLGRPERAMLALSQWRSSWLSREGVFALATYPPALILGFGWVIFEDTSGIFAVMALLTVLGAAATVYCTGMIYASLPPVSAWHNVLTTPIYLAFALMSGTLALHCLLTLFGQSSRWAGGLAMAATVLAFCLKIIWWRRVASEEEEPSTTIQSATGLAKLGKVQPLDPPHTQTNYLLHEFGFAVGRKHARRIRMLALIFGLFGPLILTLVALFAMAWVIPLLASLAFLSGVIGILLERWLFFAEAKHTSMLYYGDQKTKEDDRMPKPREQIATVPASTEPIKRQRRPVTVSITGETSR